VASFFGLPAYTAGMDIDPDTCYRALKSRDARFDGRFFTGVLSTGIFCRPVCPATTPKRKNCQFFESAAAAMATGLRPCLRCRPEAAPGSPAWKGISTTLGRALRLISEGALDEGSVEDLAARLGMGGRHLRRIFIDHMGAGPKAVAQTRRLLFAKKMISETAVPLTEIALISGFASVRRFNDAFVKVYGCPPRDLRREGGRKDKPVTGAAPSGLSLKLSFRPPFDFRQIAGFLNARAVPGLEEAGDDYYRRTVRLVDGPGVITVRPAHEKNYLIATFQLGGLSDIQQAIMRTRRLFDLDAEPAEISAHLSLDPALKKLVAARPGLRVPGAWDPFELSVRAILGQQVSVGAAKTFAARLVSTFGEPMQTENHSLTHLFPLPAALADVDLTVIGLTSRRAATVRRMAAAFADGDIDLTGFEGLAQTIRQLTALAGIGPWTANYIAMRAFGEPDAFPTGDLALIRSMQSRGVACDARTLQRRAEHWRPWRAYGALHLWHGDKKGPKK